MYSGTTFHHKSGNIGGVHQRIDRVAKRHLVHKIGYHTYFPSIKTILHFEGKNGPDGIKSKSPSQDEPWHFIKPDADLSDPLVTMITDHIHNLAKALREKDEQRAGFEAAWLSHAIVDGLTPAHHYPLAEKIEELWGKPHHERDTTLDKIVIRNGRKRDIIYKNWQYWGTRGVFNMHWTFEWGVASSIAMTKFKNIGLQDKDYQRVLSEGYETYFLESIKAVNDLNLYEEFGSTGWSAYLGQMTRKKLIPIIMKNVCLAWYVATVMAQNNEY